MLSIFYVILLRISYIITFIGTFPLLNLAMFQSMLSLRKVYNSQNFVMLICVSGCCASTSRPSLRRPCAQAVPGGRREARRRTC